MFSRRRFYLPKPRGRRNDIQELANPEGNRCLYYG